MAQTHACIRFVGLVGLLFILLPAAAQEKSEAPLKYRLKPGEAYVYAVTVVADRSDAIETLKGNIHLTVKSADDKVIHMTHSGILNSSVKAKVITKGPRMTPRGPTAIVKSREFSVTPSGKVLKLSGEQSLSYLLGNVPQLLIEPLAPDGKNRWEHSNEMNVLEVENTFPFSRLSPKTQKKSTATAITKCEIVDRKDNLVKIKKTYELKTALLAENNMPHFQMDGSGELEFDSQAGVMKSCDYKATLTVNVTNASIRVPITVAYRLMTADEVAALKKETAERLAKLKEEQKTPESKTLSDGDITIALAQLDSKNNFTFREAADKLTKTNPDEARRDEVTTKLESLLKERDFTVRMAGAKALKTWGTAKNVPALIALLKDDNGLAKNAAIEALGSIKDIKSAEAVAAILPEFSSQRPAVEALKSMGPIAEKPVLAQLKHNDWKVRFEACKVLAVIGTKDSLADLKAALSDSNALVSKEAEKAIKAIGK